MDQHHLGCRILTDAGIQDPATEMVLIHGSSGLRAAARDVGTAVRATGKVESLQQPLASKDGHDMLVRFTMKGKHDDAADQVQPVLDAVASVQRAHPSLTIGEFGDASGNKWFNDKVGGDFGRAEWTAVPLALGILLVAFGALLAAILPVALALTAFIAALGLLAAISHSMHVVDTASSVMLLMGLAVGVDYCLFYLRREREERARGR